jgi:23S rRNA (cytidine1920-2'-O)/16S rRNA (cytidine1409-2'-O)-methyltransferase
VQRGLSETRTQAQALIMAGCVFCGTKRLDKPGALIAEDTEIEVRGAAHPFASRGGIKLAHGLDHFQIDPKDLTCLDVGASTGGFTDVLLQRGAAKVYAVDVGRGQLAWKLRNDPRVIAIEGVNARNIGRDLVPEPVDLVVCDVSFISLEKILPAVLALAERARAMALIKPQFEVGKGRVGKGGVVRDPALHREVCERIAAFITSQEGWNVIGIAESPITGPAGNKEFLIAAKRAA